MAAAFQSDAFQNDAFQTAADAAATGQGLIYFIMGGGILGSYDFLNHLSRDSNAFFMTLVNVDSPTKVTASTTAANANFMEE